MAEKTHKSLQSTFAAPPQRGAKLQGMLRSRTQEPEAPADEPQAVPAPPAAEVPSTPAPTSSAPQLAQPQQTVTTLPAPSAPADMGRLVEQPETGTVSVYLRPRAYRELVDRRQRKFRSYAQTVYDAFAFVRDQAKDEQKNPTAALAALFATTAADDPWLMPEPQSAKNAAEPTVEAKIAFKAHERQWIKQRMNDVNATHMSPFLATVLEHFLLHGKN